MRGRRDAGGGWEVGGWVAVQEIAGELITGLRYGEGVTVIIIHMHEAERENRRRRSRGCELYHPVASAFPRTPKEFILMQMDGEFGHGGHERERWMGIMMCICC